MEDILIVSCIFGRRFKKVHPSPHKINSFFFTNNPDLQNEIEQKNWNYVYVNKLLVNDYLQSSLQSKYIKFIQFLDDYPEFKKYKHIIYFDHKENVSHDTLEEIIRIMIDNKEKAMIMRTTPKLKTSIQHVVLNASKHLRYKKNMKKTIGFINYSIEHNNVSEQVRICNTGLLIYIHPKQIHELVKSVYDICMEHKQPHCQIYWAIFSQKYADKIVKIEWNELKTIRRIHPYKLYIIEKMISEKLAKNNIDENEYITQNPLFQA